MTLILDDLDLRQVKAVKLMSRLQNKHFPTQDLDPMTLIKVIQNLFKSYSLNRQTNADT